MINEIIGFTGMTLILIAFLMNQLKKWKDDDLIYDLLNGLGGLGMVYYAYTLRSWPFLILNSIWALVSIRDVFLDLRKKKVFFSLDILTSDI